MKIELGRKFFVRTGIIVAVLILLIFIIWKWRSRSAYRFPELTSSMTGSYTPSGWASAAGTFTVTVLDKSVSVNPFTTTTPVTITGGTGSGAQFNIISVIPSSVGGVVGTGWTATFTNASYTAYTPSATELRNMVVSLPVMRQWTISRIETTTPPTTTSFTPPVTVTTSAAHGLVTGQTVTISGGVGAYTRFNVTAAAITIRSPTTFSYTGGTGTASATNIIYAPATGMKLEVVGTTAAYNTLMNSVQTCFTAYSQMLIDDPNDANAVIYRSNCVSHHATIYLRAKCTAITSASITDATYVATEKAIRRAYIPFMSITDGNATVAGQGLPDIASYGLTGASVGLTGTSLSQGALMRKVAERARDADIAAAARVYIYGQCPGFYDVTAPDGTDVIKNYSGLTFDSTLVTWTNIMDWAKKAYTYTYTPNVTTPTPPTTTAFNGLYGGVSSTTSTSTNMVTGTGNYASIASEPLPSTSKEYVSGLDNPIKYGEIARFFGPGTKGTGSTTMPW